MRGLTRIATASALAAGALLSLIGSAAAESETRNGRIVFTSGRDGDDRAQLHLRSVIGSSGFGTLSAPFSIAGTQNRNPSWSPDRTKVVFAAGTPAESDLFVKDLVDGGITPLDLADVGDGLSADHPAWSPDGTRIAYEQQAVKAGADRNIMIKTLGTARRAANLTTGPATELEPAWSRDSRTVYYTRTSIGGAVNHDIVSREVDGGPETRVLYTPLDESQPAVAPDGTRMCFTRQAPGNPASAEVVFVNLTKITDGFNLSDDPSRGDSDCAWAPDSAKIAYVSGVAGQSRLVMKRTDGSSQTAVELADDAGSDNFDGNPDWAPDGSPRCPDRTVTTRPETPVVLELECIDSGPEYERTDVNGFVVANGEPFHGDLSDANPTANPSTVVYTPERGFTGSDRVVYSAFDAFGFGTDEGTVTVEVSERPGPVGGGGGGASRVAVAGPPAVVAMAALRFAAPAGRRRSPAPRAMTCCRAPTAMT